MNKLEPRNVSWLALIILAAMLIIISFVQHMTTLNVPSYYPTTELMYSTALYGFLIIALVWFGVIGE